MWFSVDHHSLMFLSRSRCDNQTPGCDWLCLSFYVFIRLSPRWLLISTVFPLWHSGHSQTDHSLVTSGRSSLLMSAAHGDPDCTIWSSGHQTDQCPTPVSSPVYLPWDQIHLITPTCASGAHKFATWTIRVTGGASPTSHLRSRWRHTSGRGDVDICV